MNGADTDPLTHDHNFLSGTHDTNARRTLRVAGLTAVMMVGEIIAGLIYNSMALLADGFHMATHAAALGIAVAAYAYAKHHAADRQFSFGTGKIGDLAGFASALILGLVALGIAVESVSRLIDPRAVDFGPATLVAILGLAVNLISALLLGGGDHHHNQHGHGHGHTHAHHQTHGHRDNNLRSAYFHVLADALTSMLAIIALVAGRYLGWVWLDPMMGIIGAIVIARWSWSLMRDTAAVLLDRTDRAIEAEVREFVEGPGDAHITDLHVWRIGPEAHAAIVSVTGGVDGKTVRERLRPIHELGHLTVECR